MINWNISTKGKLFKKIFKIKKNIIVMEEILFNSQRKKLRWIWASKQTTCRPAWGEKVKFGRQERYAREKRRKLGYRRLGVHPPRL